MRMQIKYIFYNEWFTFVKAKRIIIFMCFDLVFI